MSQFVEVKTSELVGPALDWAVGRCSGMPLFTMGDDWPGNYRVTVMAGEQPILILDLTKRMWREHQGVTVPWMPSTDWSQGGPLLDIYTIKVESYPKELGEGRASARLVFTGKVCWQCGDTVLIALLRAIVAGKLGEVVQVPAELVEVRP